MKFSFLVSAQILKGSLDSMDRQIQRLESDVQNFPKTDDIKDKFVEKMAISLPCFLFCPEKHKTAGAMLVGM